MSSHKEGVPEQAAFAADFLKMDLAAETERIASRVRDILRDDLRRRGLVVAISGGIDSSVCAALSVAAVGAERVLALLLPERDSSPESLARGRQLAEHLGVAFEVQDIGDTLAAIGCYNWRDAAIRRVVPEYGEGWRSKIAIRSGAHFSHFVLVVQDPQGAVREERLAAPEYLQIVAATNFKQRIRKTIEYFHADRLNYAVVGTPNRLEYDQGFFVKNGDGSADLKPIAHLYKSQVYALARHLGLPEAICTAIPTTDTYSLEQGQDEFYFSLPYRDMDVALALLNSGAPAARLADYLGASEEQAELIYADIRRKRQTTAYLHRKPVLVENLELAPVADISCLEPASGSGNQDGDNWTEPLRGVAP